MPIIEPEVGLVISYAYLWRHEHKRGQEEGRKTRPCVIVLSVEEIGNDMVVTVVPITHAPPSLSDRAIEIPAKVKQHLGLDDARSWAIVDEVNQFAWPGYDLRPVPGHKFRYDFGFIPPRLYEKIKERLLSLFLARRVKVTKRD